MKKVNLGILGMGTVAGGLVKIIESNKNKISGISDVEFLIKKVLVRDIGRVRNNELSKGLYTTDGFEVVNDENIDIVVELIGGLDAAYDYIKKALENGKHVVTANKALIATKGEELENLANDKGVELMYEASVGGGIPVINTMRDHLSINEFEEIIGIINGTTNFILTQMTEEGLEFDQAVKTAQDLGFAEADPSSDVDGDDAAYKLAILSTLAFGKRFKIADVLTEGITKISKEDIIYADELGYNIKLLASAQKKDNEVELRVHPALVAKGHPLTTVKNEFNAVFLKGNATGEIMIYGKGAGALPTGSAVMSDIFTITRNMSKDGCHSPKYKNDKIKIVNKGNNQYYIRFEVFDKPGVLGNIAHIFGMNNVSIASVVQRQKNGETTPLVFITHNAARSDIDLTLEFLKDYKDVAEIASIIIVEKI